MSLFSPGLEAKVRQFLLARAHRIPQDASLKVLLDTVREDFPEEIRSMVRLIQQETLNSPDPRAQERRERIQEVMRADGYYAGDLAPRVPGTKGFTAFNTQTNHTVKEAREATLAWVGGGALSILVLAGPPGVGKTHLAGAAAQRLLEGGEEVAYRTEAELMGELHLLDFKGMENRLQDYSVIPWLVLDDLGTQALGDWGRAIEDRLVDARWRDAGPGLRTLVTTNLKGADLPPRVASRLGDKERSQVVQIMASDYRAGGRE